MLLAKRSPLSARVVLIIGTIVALLLVWWVFVVGSRALLDVDAASSNAFEQSIRAGVTPDVVWREQIARDPTNARPYRKLAQVLDQEGKQSEAAAAIEQALRLDPTDPAVLQNAGEFYLRTGNVDRALPIFRRAVELYSSLGDDVWPVFAAELESGRGTEFMQRAARENPAWWPRFFSEYCNKAENTEVPARLLIVRADARVLTDPERACLIGRLQREGRWAEAREVWLTSLPAEQRQHVGNVFNGGFEWPLSNLGFDWIVRRQDGTIAEVLPTDRARGARALSLRFVNARYGGPPLQQHLMLRAGRYRLEGNERADGFDAWLGLQWGVYCLPTGNVTPRQLTKTDPLIGSAEWKHFERDFSVPADCPIQMLRLELANPRRDAETPGNVAARLRGSVWYDDIGITSLD